MAEMLSSCRAVAAWWGSHLGSCTVGSRHRDAHAMRGLCPLHGLLYQQQQQALLLAKLRQRGQGHTGSGLRSRGGRGAA